MNPRLTRPQYFVVVLAMLLASAGSGGLMWYGWQPAPKDKVNLASLEPEVASRYQFVHANHDLARRIPCYCGCGDFLGHESLLDCFVTREGGFNDHAAGCGVCGREADDVAGLSGEGREPQAVRAWIDTEYAGLGRPTRTP